MEQQAKSSVLRVLAYHERLASQRTRKGARFLANHQRTTVDNDDSRASLVRPSMQFCCLLYRAPKR